MEKKTFYRKHFIEQIHNLNFSINPQHLFAQTGEFETRKRFLDFNTIEDLVKDVSRTEEFVEIRTEIIEDLPEDWQVQVAEVKQQERIRQQQEEIENLEREIETLQDKLQFYNSIMKFQESDWESRKKALTEGLSEESKKALEKLPDCFKFALPEKK